MFTSFKLPYAKQFDCKKIKSIFESQNIAKKSDKPM